MSFTLGVCLATLAIASPPTGAATLNLIGHWTGDGSAVDTSGRGHDGSFAGGYVPGRIGRAFDLARGPVVIPDSPDFNLDAYEGFTAAFWVNMNRIAPTTYNQHYIGQDEGPGEFPKWFVQYDIDALNLVFHINDYDSDPREFLAAGPATISNDAWTHIAVARDSDRFRFYVDGHKIGEASYAREIPNPNAELYFGFLETNFEGIPLEFRGLMDDVRLYNRALSSDEVASIAAVPLPGGIGMALVGATVLAGLGRLGIRTRGSIDRTRRPHVSTNSLSAGSAFAR
jgi:hypothetical protein